MKRMRLIVIACLLSGIVHFHCTSPSSPLAHNTGGSEVVGTLVLKTTGGPAKNAQVIANKVLLSSAGLDSLVFADSVLADTGGVYKFDSLLVGKYDFECKAVANKDTFYGSIKDFRLDSVAPPKQPTIIYHVGVDTLYPPGSISGQVNVNYPVNLQHIFCTISGTSYNATPDDTGAFKISNIPMGTYTVLFSYNGTDFSLADTQLKYIVVQSDSNTYIGTIKMYLSSIGDPPMPLGLQAFYDSFSGTVALSWGSVPVPDFKNFIILRENSNNSAGYVQIDSTRDTFFIDKINFTDTVGYSVFYKIQCFDSSGGKSQQSPAITINVKPPAGKTTVHLAAQDSAGLFDYVNITANYTNPSALVKKLIWTNANGDTIQVKDSVYKSSGTDIAKISCNKTGRLAVYLTTIDNLGRISTDSIFVTVVLDKPVIKYLSPSQTINFGGTVQCSVAVSHQFGLCTLRVHLNGNTSPELKRVGLVFDSAFSTGPALTWDSVKIKVTDSHGNSISTGFSVAILPPQPQNQWVLSPTPMINHHSWHASCVINGVLYVIGGTKMQLGAGGNANPVQTSAVEAYDTLNKTWTTLDSLRNARYDFSACVVNNKIYIVGGIGKRGYVTIMEQYDPQANVWTIFDTTQIGQNQFLRAGSACCAVGTKIYLFGGRTLSADSSSNIACQNIFIYDVSNKKWSENPSIHLNTARYDFQAAPLNGKIYLMGGLGVDDDPLKSIEIFDTISGMCTVSSNNLPEELNNFSAVAMNSNIYVIGGINSSMFSVLESVRFFNPVSGSWSTLAPLPQPAYNTAAAVINNKIYLSGGLNDFNPPINETFDKTLYIYYP